MGIFSKVGSIVNDVLGTTSAMKAQNQQQWDMWNAQNAYNTPAEQMKRLKDAGLNPMLVYGHGSVAGNTAGSMSAASGSSGGAGSSVLSALAKSPWTVAKMGQDIALGQAQINQVKANNKLLHAQLQKVNADTMSAMYNLDLAKSRGVRDGALSTSEAFATLGQKAAEKATTARQRRLAEDEKFNKEFFDWW